MQKKELTSIEKQPESWNTLDTSTSKLLVEMWYLQQPILGTVVCFANRIYSNFLPQIKQVQHIFQGKPLSLTLKFIITIIRIISLLLTCLCLELLCRQISPALPEASHDNDYHQQLSDNNSPQCDSMKKKHNCNTYETIFGTFHLGWDTYN